MDTIFKFLHSIMVTLTLQISKLTKAVVLNSFPHGRFWQFVYKENVRCTRLMQRSLQVVIRQMFVLCSLKIEAQRSEPMSFTFHSALRKLNTDRTFYSMSSILDFRGLYFCAAYFNLTSGKLFKKNFYYLRTRLYVG